jgi:hypothetical protein
MNLNSEYCSAIAFYGIECDSKASASFYRTVIDWFRRLGFPPDKLGVKGLGMSGELSPFAVGERKVQESGFNSVVDFEITCSTPNARTGHDYYLTASYNRAVESQYAVIVARSTIATLSPSSMLPIARRLVSELKPSYGIGYKKKHQLGPEFYAGGICYGGQHISSGADYEEAKSISRWCDLGMVKRVYVEGLLRDVYPWNFLTQSHLAKTVDGTPLWHWIQRDRSRGSLNSVGEGVCLWEVSDTEIPKVRTVLSNADVIFNWRKYLKVRSTTH